MRTTWVAGCLCLLLIPMGSFADTTVVVGQPVAAGPAGCTGTAGNNVFVSVNLFPSNFHVQIRKITLACAGTATGVFTYIQDSETNLREVIHCIYNDASGVPGTLHSSSGAVFGYDPGWATDATFLPSFTAGVYWIGIIKESSATDIYHDSDNPVASTEAYNYTHNTFACPADLTSLSPVGTTTNFTTYVNFD